MCKYVSAAALVCFVVAGCNQNGPKVAELQENVTDLQQTVELLKSRLDGADNRIAAAETSLFVLDSMRSATFSTTDKGYSRIDSDAGNFLVSLKNVLPYANGYKVTFDLGNPQSVSYEEIELELRWGPKRPADGFKTVSYADWNKQFQTTKQTVSKRILPGAWNTVQVVLAPATPEQIGQIGIEGIKTSKVFMAVR